jgi:hypothetical protein
MRVDFRAQFEERLQAHFDQEIVGGPISHSPEQLKRDESETEKQDETANGLERRMAYERARRIP